MMMRALKAFDYQRRRLRAGDVFEPASVADRDALALVELAAVIEDDADKPFSEIKKRHYKRRDLRAEDE